MMRLSLRRLSSYVLWSLALLYASCGVVILSMWEPGHQSRSSPTDLYESSPETFHTVDKPRHIPIEREHSSPGLSTDLQEPRTVDNQNQALHLDIAQEDKLTVNRSEVSNIERRHFIYVKQHKCASQTTVGIFRRFGYSRNLSFVLPHGYSRALGWPYPISRARHLPAKSDHFDILCDHVVLNETYLSAIMSNDTVMILGLRQPFQRARSAFYYGRFDALLNITGETPFLNYINNMSHYERIYTSHALLGSRVCIPDGLSMTRNQMGHSLGFPTGFPPGTPDRTNDVMFLADWLRYMDRRVHAVIIVEHFTQSLVVLKRKMLWNFGDIVYMSQNKGRYSTKQSECDDVASEAIYRKSSPVDYALYEHFNASLWTEIASFGDDFKDEVECFAAVNAKVQSFCEDIARETRNVARTSAQTLSMPSSQWSEGFVVNNDFCLKISRDHMGLLKSKYHETPPITQETEPNAWC